MTDYKQPQERDIAMVLAALKSLEMGDLDYRTLLYGLSNLDANELEQVIPVWDSLDVASRRKLMQQMLESSETDFTMDYQAIGLHSLNDPEPQIRSIAIETLWADESLSTMDLLIALAQNDESADVRAVAASALGRFILLGELGELADTDIMRAEDAMANLWQDVNEPVEVRRRALEALSNCSHTLVPEAIHEAYESGDGLLLASALFAMGRAYNPQWAKYVLRELDNPDPLIRFEAARAAGELEIEDALPNLGRLTQEDDIEIKEVAIWSLGEIGGREALRILEQLAEEAHEAQNDVLIEAIEDSMANASMVGGNLPFMFELDEDVDEWDDLDQLDD